MSASETYTAYTDGGCSPNPGPGGWGVVLVRPDGRRQELSGGEPRTTNNRMELTAAVQALRAVPPGVAVRVVTDSLYLKKGVTAWLDGWRRAGWKTKSGTPVKNRDLWEVLDAEARRRTVRWAWTRGHAGDPLNERADALASSHIAGAPAAELPLGDRDAVHAFVGVAFAGPRRKGAWEVVLCDGDRQRTVGGSVSETTANRVLIHAGIDALEAVDAGRTVHVYTQATYLGHGASRWLPGWKRAGWRTKEGSPVASAELWRRLDALQSGRTVRWHVVGKADLPPEIEAARELARARLA